MDQPLLFQDVARGIIKETISNAVFIDDKAILPFKSLSRNLALRPDQQRSIDLYNDFKAKDCLLLISRFSKRSWKRDKDFNLNNKDLLILDWQLVRDEHEESLKILDQSVVKKGLHFCCIYTQASLEEVKNELNRFYLGKLSQENVAEIRATISESDLNDYWLIEKTEEDQVELDLLINSIVNAKKDDKAKEIKAFQERYGLDDESITSISNIDPINISAAFVKFRTALTLENEIFTNLPHENLAYRLSEFDRNTVYINHTIVKLFQKNNVSGDQLYSSFFDSILMENNIFLTLMGLEMRNRFRENSAFIGKDLDTVSEEAFFYHKLKNKDHPHIFEDFLREILKDQVASFLYEKNLKIFNSLEDYSATKGMPARIAAFEGDGIRLVDESFKLNKFYNLININSRKLGDTLRFGDIFKSNVTVTVKDQRGVLRQEVALRYFICITPLCDCLRPSKINNQFWFVEGQEEASENSVLKGTDGKFFSFLHNGTKVIAVDWKNKKDFVMPFAMNITDPIVTKNLITHYYNEAIELELVASLKENYAQRIANEAFGYPIRVGIDFVKKS